MLKKIICTFLALIVLSVPTLAETDTSGELKIETIYEGLNNQLDYLNRFVGCSGPIHDPDDHIKLGEYDIYSPNTKFTSYRQTKAELLEFCSPYLTMVALSNSVHINVNDKIYSYDEFLAPFTEGGMPYYNKIEIISSSENSTLFNYNYIVDGEILLLGIGEYVKIDGEWKLDAVDGMIGQTSQSRTYEDARHTFERYAANVLLSYIISENKSCGYGKYLMEPSDSESGEPTVCNIVDIVVTEFDEKECTGSAYIYINEYDKNVNMIATKQITVDIGKNLTETVTVQTIGQNPNTADISRGYICIAILAATVFGIVLNTKKKV